MRFLLPATLLALLISCTPVPIEPEKPTEPEQPEQPIEPEEPKPPRPELEQIGAWLKTIPGVSEVKEIEQEEYKKYFTFRFEQLIDPKDLTKGTFTQRVFLSHQDFDSPMVFDAQGYDSQESEKGPQTNELTERYHANLLEVEHRYAGESVPLDPEWLYLTCENAVADMHAVRKALGVAYTGSWIATGGSKNGTNAMTYAMYYPDDIVATVAYVGPICNGLDDPRFLEHLMRVGTPEMRKKIEDFQILLLNRRSTLQAQLISVPEPSISREQMTLDQEYDNFILTFAQAQWQYGLPVDKIPNMDATDDEVITYLDTRFTQKTGENSSLKGFGKANATPDFNNNHYNVQLLKELGGAAPGITPGLEPLMANYELWSKNLLARFIVPVSASHLTYSDQFYRKITQWFKEKDPLLICVYGEYDYWTGGMPDQASFAGKTNMELFIQKAGDHSSCIEELDPSQKQRAWSKLDNWVKKK